MTWSTALLSLAVVFLLAGAIVSFAAAMRRSGQNRTAVTERNIGLLRWSAVPMFLVGFALIVASQIMDR